MRLRSLSAICVLLATFACTRLSGQSVPTSPPSLSGISSGGTVELGQLVVLRVLFSGAGDGQTYQWSRSGTAIPGATDVTYTIPAATSSDAGTYTVSVANAAGASVATTNLTVKPAAPPVITVSPRDRVAEEGQSVTFSYTATGSYPRTHVWRRGGVTIPGASSAVLSLTNITTADAGAYSVQVTNALGSATSESAALTVNAARPPVISSFSPTDATFTHGQSGSLGISFSSGSSPFSFQWLKAGVPIAGATSSQLTFTAATPADAGRYSVRVSNVAGSATSREATVTVNPATPLTIVRSPDSVTIAQGQTASFNVSLSGTPPYTYQWLKNNTAIPGATHSNYTLYAATFGDGGNYAVTVTNVLGPVTSIPAALIVTPAVAPTILTHPASRTIPYNHTLELSVQANGTTPLTFQWRKDGAPISGAVSSSYFASSVTPAQN